MHRPVGAAPAFLAVDRTLHALEIGEHVGERPAGRALLGPMVEVAGVTAHIDHAVDRRRAADHLAARRGENAAAEMRLGLGRKAPVVEAHAHRERQRGRHLDERAGVAAAILDDDDAVPAVLRQAVGKRCAGRAGTDDDEICFKHFRCASRNRRARHCRRWQSPAPSCRQRRGRHRSAPPAMRRPRARAPASCARPRSSSPCAPRRR